MFLRAKVQKDGKLHCYFSVVEKRRAGRKRIAQRTVFYLGEINGSQEAPWRKTLEISDESLVSRIPRTKAAAPSTT